MHISGSLGFMVIIIFMCSYLKTYFLLRRYLMFNVKSWYLITIAGVFSRFQDLESMFWIIIFLFFFITLICLCFKFEPCPSP